MVKSIEIYGFPTDTRAEEAKVYLERVAGRGSIYALEVVQPKRRGQRAYVRVQFTTKRYADLALLLAERKRLWHGRFFMKAQKLNHDFAQRQRSYLHSIDNVTLNFGCQTGKEKFNVLWKRINVKVRFGLGKIYFFMSHCSVEYKLVLSSENIWQIELRRPRSQTNKFLLIQLVGAPHVYAKEVPESIYYKEDTDDQWIRELDFTPERYIGQSSALCLEIPRKSHLPTSVYTHESDDHLMLERGSSFSHDRVLVPIVRPPRGIDLPFEIVFKINSLLQHGCLPGPAVDSKFFRLVDPKKIKLVHIEHALNRLYNLKECCYDPVRWLSEQYRKYLTSGRLLRSPAISLDDGLVYVRRVQITPCKVYFGGPEVNLSNRVLRNYIGDIDNFIRVSFVDEELNKLFSSDLTPRASSPNEERRTRVYNRVLSILRDGISVGDKNFEFLAFSSSQLRENSIWMFASRPGLTASDIREWMGDFHDIRNVAKYAARLGQSFGSSRETLSVHRDEVEFIPDVEVVRNGVNYVFSDGIGKISEELALKVAKKIGFKNSTTPSAFQIRYGGCKGVVAVDPTSFVKLSLRKSMSKYKSDNTKLDVLSWSKYHPCFLNRQLVTLLSTLGVGDRVFQKKQREAVAQLDSVLTDPLKAREALEMMAPGENTHILKEMLRCGYEPNGEPFLAMMLQTFRASKLLDLRLRTRIYLPNGRAMMGCLDETKLLDYGEVFVQVSSSSGRRGNSSTGFEEKHVVEGKVVVAKNPCLHPGDVRVLKAVDVPSLRHMVDCVVFPQKGKRPHPNECSGSDLDGDIYFVCWDPDLIPPRQIQPMDYTPAPTMILGHDVTIQEIQEYFADYIANDSLGVIANAHTVFADKEAGKATSESCIHLAKLFSIAVDFPKTGVPAKVPPHLRVKEYPDFMEKPNRPTYESQNVIGKLYREVRDVPSDENLVKPASTQFYDPDMEVDGSEDYLDDAFACKNEYDERLTNLMDYYGIKTEAEILSGSVMKMDRSFDRKKDLEAVSYAVNSLRKETRTWFNEEVLGSDARGHDVYAKASAWYYVTYHPAYWGRCNEGMGGDHFLSFPWCVHDKLLHIKRSKTSLSLYVDRSGLIEPQLSQEVHLN